MNLPELEIGLYPRDADQYMVDLRFIDPVDEASRAPVMGAARFDMAALRAALLDPEAYGKLLGESLFSETALREHFNQCRAAAEISASALRLRLAIDPGAAALHSLRWETLRDPTRGDWLVASENVIFSRFLGSSGWERVQLRAQSELRALVVIANPQDLADGNFVVQNQTLTPVDVQGELQRARESLGDLPMDVLASDPAQPGQASLARLLAQLRQGYDILYLAAHGALLNRQPAGPYLWLENDDGTADVVPGANLIDPLKDLPVHLRPRLVALASCQSAGQGGEARSSDVQGALAALGPQLSRAGIPAVIAMQGDVSMATIAGFMPVFFRELRRDGAIDRAVAAARSAIRQRPDAWMPVLTMRLRSGKLWYTPGFSGERADFEKWPALARSINRGQCTPILGPGLYESLLGTQREIARRWAERYNYPMEPHERESMPEVAQFLKINQYDHAPLDELEEYGIDAIRMRHVSLLPERLHGGPTTLDEIMEVAGAAQRQQDPNNPYQLLARLRLPVYITTNLNNLMASSLEAEGVHPEVMLCPWNEHVEILETIFDREPGYYPTPDRPLVYHLFGRLKEPDSVVLTEDDYFDYLIGVTRNQDLIPEAVRRAFTDTALLFLGFQLDDWQFRVLLRSILAQQGRMRRARYPHIAAQIGPEEGRILEPERARHYLEAYFTQDAQISLYWGSVEDFVKDLKRHVQPVTS